MKQIPMFESELTHKDIKELGSGRKRVKDLMLDGLWHSATDIRLAAKGSEGLRRLRELRKSYNIEKRRITSEKRHFEYRIIR